MDKSLIPEHYEAMVKVARKLAKEDMTFFPAIKNNTDKELNVVSKGKYFII